MSERFVSFEINNYFRSIEDGFVGKLIGFSCFDGEPLMYVLAQVNYFTLDVEYEERRWFDPRDLARCSKFEVSFPLL